jgi:hypothetical protein
VVHRSCERATSGTYLAIVALNQAFRSVVSRLPWDLGRLERVDFNQVLFSFSKIVL